MPKGALALIRVHLSIAGSKHQASALAHQRRTHAREPRVPCSAAPEHRVKLAQHRAYVLRGTQEAQHKGLLPRRGLDAGGHLFQVRIQHGPGDVQAAPASLQGQAQRGQAHLSSVEEEEEEEGAQGLGERALKLCCASTLCCLHPACCRTVCVFVCTYMCACVCACKRTRTIRAHALKAIRWQSPKQDSNAEAKTEGGSRR